MWADYFTSLEIDYNMIALQNITNYNTEKEKEIEDIDFCEIVPSDFLAKKSLVAILQTTTFHHH